MMPARDLGIYVHVPFCASKCSYCDFYSEPRAYLAAFTDALLRELEKGQVDLTPALASTRVVDSVYLGGGTPSLMPARDVARLLEAIAARFTLARDAEITLEANPATLDEVALRALSRAGVNRLSIGVQALSPPALRLLGRRHDPAQAVCAVEQARAAGFDNLSLDVILAIPGQSLEESRDDLEAIAALEPEHVSAYLLTLEPGTPLTRAVARGEVTVISQELAADMLVQAVGLLEARGLRRYEISNFARAGRAARHNRRYWSGGDYLGLGPGAHSHFLEPGGVGRRFSTPADLEAYLRHFVHGERAALDHLERTDERLEPRAYLLERIYLGLRDLERGADLDAAARDAGCQPWGALLATLAELEQRGLLIRRGQTRRLSAQGSRLADLVSREILGVSRGDQGPYSAPEESL